MIELAQKAFAKLMAECQKIDVKHAEFYTPDTARIEFTSKEETYRKIVTNLSLKQIQLNDISDILTHSKKNNLDPMQSIDFIRNSIEKTLVSINNFTAFLMPHQFAQLYFNKALVAYKQGHFEEAIECWEKILKVEPHNNIVQSMLLEILKKKGVISKKIKYLQKKYRLDFINSFGHGHISCTYNMAINEQENRIFVSDHVSNKICMFNLKGEFISEFSKGLKHPLGLFKGIHNDVWICDFGNNRLLSISPHNQVIDEINIKEAVGKSFPTTHPLDGCVVKDQFYLILQDQNRQQSQIISLRRHPENASIETIPLGGVKTSCCIRSFDTGVYVGAADPAGVYMLNHSLKKFSPLNSLKLSNFLRSFVIVENFFYITAGEYLYKISPDEFVFIADLRELTGLKSAIHSSIDAYSENGNQFLVMADTIQGCLHTFHI